MSCFEFEWPRDLFHLLLINNRLLVLLETKTAVIMTQLLYLSRRR